VFSGSSASRLFCSSGRRRVGRTQINQ
jgi:hypothetical protein